MLSNRIDGTDVLGNHSTANHTQGYEVLGRPNDMSYPGKSATKQIAFEGALIRRHDAI